VVLQGVDESMVVAQGWSGPQSAAAAMSSEDGERCRSGNTAAVVVVVVVAADGESAACGEGRQ